MPPFLNGKGWAPFFLGLASGCVAYLFASVLVPPLSLLIGSIAGNFVFVATKISCSVYVDEVFFSRGKLLIRDRGIEEEIPFIKIKRIEWSVDPLFMGITLVLTDESKLGRKILFLPATWRIGYPKLATALNARVDRAHLKAALERFDQFPAIPQAQ